MRKLAFTLIELLVVIAILAILAAIIFPTMARAKAAANQTGCISNLRQIGMGLGMYMTDHDDVFPHAIDPVDKFQPSIWDPFPEFRARIPQMPLISEALEPYVKSKEIWRCPSDSGSVVVDNHPWLDFRAAPSTYKTFGTSYFFRTEIAFKAFTSTQFQLPANVNVLFDASGHWHGSAGAIQRNEPTIGVVDKLRKFRYSTLYGDLHVKSVTYDQLQEAWDVAL